MIAGRFNLTMQRAKAQTVAWPQRVYNVSSSIISLTMLKLKSNLCVE